MGELGIEHSKKVLVDISKLAMDGIYIAKRGAGLGSLKALWDIVGHTKDLMIESHAAFPELKDLDKQEAAELAEACYDLLREVINAIVT